MDHSHILGLSGWKPLARGGLAVVWLARQESLDRLVAVKVYLRQLGDDDRRRFFREVIALGQLSDHPAIVTAYDAGILPDDRPYLITEYCSGGSLTQWLKPDGRPPEERVRDVGVRMADALAAVHARGMLHRDVKPANILLDSYGNPRLADFGLVVATGSEAAGAASLGVTPAYAPPEALRLQPATPFGDVFSLAATMYALLARGLPQPTRGLPQHTSTTPDSFAQLAEAAQRSVEPLATVDSHLMGVLMGALSNDPRDRPTAAGFRDQLAEVPTSGTSNRRPLTVAAGETGSVRRRSLSAVPGDSALPNGRRHVEVAAAARDLRRPPSPAGNAGSPPRGPVRRTGILALTAVLIAAITFSAALLTRLPGTQTAFPAGLPPNPGAAQASESVGPTARPTAGAGQHIDSGSVKPRAVRLRQPALSGEPFETVRIRGVLRGGAGEFLRVQRWEDGRWLAFPLPAKTDRNGRFTAYVELGTAGAYRLRVIHPDSGVRSKPFVLVIRG